MAYNVSGIESMINEDNDAEDNETKVDVNDNVTPQEFDSMGGEENNLSDAVDNAELVCF